jgi:large-conductance mechanosensitive channel
MIGEALGFLTSKVTGDLADKWVTKIIWSAIALVALIIAIVYLAIAIDAYLVPTYGRVKSALMIAGFAIVSAGIFAIIPKVVSKTQETQKATETLSETVEKVEAEAREAVDYIGAARVLASAFVFGMTTARTLKSRG